MEADEKKGFSQIYIDLHCHLVANVDDGAASEDETKRMLDLAERDGIKTIVATPHVFSSHCSEKDPHKIFEAVGKLVDACSKSGSPVEVLPGAEVFFTSNLSEYLSEYRDFLTLNHSSYFLLEFPFDFIFHGATDFIYRVMMEGLIPIIAHAERNRIIQRNPGLVYEMVQMGALCQVNAASFTGYFGEMEEDLARLLLRNNLVHVIASDAHSAGDRRPEISGVIEQLSKEGFSHAAMFACDVPLAIINDEGIPDTGSPEDPVRHKRFFDFFLDKFK